MPRKKEMGRSANGIGTIRKKTVTKNGKEYTYWEARCTVGYDPGTGRQIQRSITGKTQKEVTQKLKVMTVEVDQGSHKPPCKLTVKDWLETWMIDFLGDVKKSTAHEYKRSVDTYIVPHLGAMKLEALTAPMIQAFCNDLQHPKQEGTKPLAAKTVKNVRGVLHKALEQAVESGYLRVNPSDATKAPKVKKPEIHPLEDEQVTDFLAAIKGHVHEELYVIDMFTGLRQGEILGLKWDCIDFDRGTLVVKQQLCRERKKGGKYYFDLPKHDKIRVLSLAPSVVKWLRIQKLKQGEKRLKAGEAWTENNLVFSNETGGYLSYRTVYDCFKRIVAKIGTPDTRFHDLRHTYAVMCLANGDDIKTLQENLGHATAAFTLDVYGHVLKRMRQASTDRMEAFIQSLSAG